MVKVREVVPATGTLTAPNALLIDGGPTTLRVAVAVLPEPPSVEDTLPVTLFLTPAVVPVTFTRTVQLMIPPPNEVVFPPVREMELEPATAVTVPLQLLVRPLGVATTSPAGRVSVKAKPVCTPAPLSMVKVRLVLPFRAMASAPKALVMLAGGGAITVRVAVAVLPMPPSVEETLSVMLTLEPAVVPVTPTCIEHIKEPAMREVTPPVREMDVEPVVAVSVPPQPLRNKIEFVARTNPAGRLSMKATPV